MQKWWHQNKTEIKLRLLSGAHAGAMLGTSAFAGLPVITPVILIGAMYASSALWSDKKNMDRRLGDNSYEPDKNDPLSKKVRALSEDLGLDMPAVYIGHPRYNDYNAASWSENFPKKNSAVKLSGTLFTPSYPGRPPLLNEEEQEAIILHELMHIKRKDSASFRTSIFIGSATTICAAVAAFGAVSGILPATMAATAIGLKVAGSLAHFAHQRQTERAVDESVVKHTGKPDVYVRALNKVHEGHNKLIAFYKNAKDVVPSKNMQYGWVAYRQEKRETPAFDLFQKLSWLRTHPAPAERIAHIYDVAEKLGIKSDSSEDGLSTAADTSIAPSESEGVVLPPGTEQYRTLKTRDNGNIVIALTSLSITNEFNEAANSPEMNESLKDIFEIAAQKVLDDAERQVRQDKNLGKLLP